MRRAEKKNEASTGVLIIQKMSVEMVSNTVNQYASIF